MNPRRLFIRFVTPWIWRSSAQRELETLQKFSLIEKDSGCQILRAMESVRDPRVKAVLFQQVLEEFHHHDLFESACLSLARAPLPVPVITRDDLVGDPSDRSAVLDFLSYLHVGEREVNKDFGVYEAAAIDKRIAAVFHAVRMDEAHHEKDSLDLLKEVAGSPLRLRFSLLKSLLVRWCRTYAGAMKEIGKYPLFLLLGSIYFLVGPFFCRLFRKRLEMPSEQQLEILSERARTFAAAAK